MCDSSQADSQDHCSLQVHPSCWPETSMLLHMSLPVGQLTMWHLVYIRVGQRTRESAPDRSNNFFVTHSQSGRSSFCHILFIRSESISPAHMQGERSNYTRMWKSVGITRGTVDFACCARVCVCAHACVFMYINIHTCMCVCIHKYIYMYTYLHIYISREFVLEIPDHYMCYKTQYSY